MSDKPALLIIGNSNVGKSSITRLLLPESKLYKGKTGKLPGSTMLIKTISHPDLPYSITDLPGFGYMKETSKRREEHIKKQIILHIEKHYSEYFLGLVIINILRIEDEITKYHSKNTISIPLSYELIHFLRELKLPVLVIINKIDKISDFHKRRLLSLFLDTAKNYDLNLVPLTRIEQYEPKTPYLEFSALKKINLTLLKRFIEYQDSLT